MYIFCFYNIYHFSYTLYTIYIHHVCICTLCIYIFYNMYTVHMHLYNIYHFSTLYIYTLYIHTLYLFDVQAWILFEVPGVARRNFKKLNFKKSIFEIKIYILCFFLRVLKAGSLNQLQPILTVWPAKANMYIFILDKDWIKVLKLTFSSYLFYLNFYESIVYFIILTYFIVNFIIDVP